jgi:hypothetical protein
MRFRLGKLTAIRGRVPSSLIAEESQVATWRAERTGAVPCYEDVDGGFKCWYGEAQVTT